MNSLIDELKKAERAKQNEKEGTQPRQAAVSADAESPRVPALEEEISESKPGGGAKQAENRPLELALEDEPETITPSGDTSINQEGTRINYTDSGLAINNDATIDRPSVSSGTDGSVAERTAVSSHEYKLEPDDTATAATDKSNTPETLSWKPDNTTEINDNDAPGNSPDQQHSTLPLPENQGISKTTGHQQQQHFDRKQPTFIKRWLVPTVVIFTLMITFTIIAIAGGWWYFWKTSRLGSETDFTINNLRSHITQRAKSIGSTFQKPVINSLPATNASQTSEADIAANKPVLSSNTGVSAPLSENIEARLAATSPPMLPVNTPTVNDTDNSPATKQQTTVRPSATNPIKIQKGATSQRTNQQLSNAWEAYQSGDYLTADKLYSKVLENAPKSRDALRGKAALAMQKNNISLAKQYYIKLLEHHPNDPETLAYLMSFVGRQKPMDGISQLNTLLDKYPQIPGLHFTLGNLYAVQSRWTEAQQSFFQAWTLDNDNPDYLYNLAISLDHLEKSSQALRFYQLAIGLSNTQKVHFSVPRLQQRIQELTSANDSE